VYNAVHADNIANCAEVCDIYADIGSCDFYTYDTNGAIDENCKIYAFDETIPEFQAKCITIALPVGNSCVFYDDTCEVSDDCPACVACGTGTCGGYMESECELQGGTVETHPGVPFGTCQKLCKVDGASYLKWNRETQDCICLNEDKRLCKMQIVKQGTDVADCKA